MVETKLPQSKLHSQTKEETQFLDRLRATAIKAMETDDTLSQQLAVLDSQTTTNQQFGTEPYRLIGLTRGNEPAPYTYYLGLVVTNSTSTNQTNTALNFNVVVDDKSEHDWRMQQSRTCMTYLANQTPTDEQLQDMWKELAKAMCKRMSTLSAPRDGAHAADH